MNRVKEFNMSPQDAYKFATGKLQINDDSFVSEQMHTELVLRADEIIPNTKTKIKDYLKDYFAYKIDGKRRLYEGIENSWKYKIIGIFDPSQNEFDWHTAKMRYVEWRKMIKEKHMSPNVLTDEEKEVFLQAPKWATKYAKFTNKRFPSEMEKKFIKREGLNNRQHNVETDYVLEYCAHFGIVVDNYNEIVLTEGFGVKDKFSQSKKEYLKKINEQKTNYLRLLKDLLEQNGLSKEDKIEKLFEALA
jgi:hypothetical protein